MLCVLWPLPDCQEGQQGWFFGHVDFWLGLAGRVECLFGCRGLWKLKYISNRLLLEGAFHAHSCLSREHNGPKR
jgi:hypothetical protein